MAKLFNLAGSYSMAGNFLKNGNVKLLIAKRKEITKGKSSTFLLDKSKKQGAYISSLYYLPENSTSTETYSFDYQGHNYTLVLNKASQTATINQKSPLVYQ